MRVPAPIVIGLTIFGRKAKFCPSAEICHLADNRRKEDERCGCPGRRHCVNESARYRALGGEGGIAAHSMRWAIWSAPNRSKSLCRGAATPGLSSERLFIISSRKPSVRYYLAYGHF